MNTPFNITSEIYLHKNRPCYCYTPNISGISKVDEYVWIMYIDTEDIVIAKIKDIKLIPKEVQVLYKPIKPYIEFKSVTLTLTTPFSQ